MDHKKDEDDLPSSVSRRRTSSDPANKDKAPRPLSVQKLDTLEEQDARYRTKSLATGTPKAHLSGDHLSTVLEPPNHTSSSRLLPKSLSSAKTGLQESLSSYNSIINEGGASDDNSVEKDGPICVDEGSVMDRCPLILITLVVIIVVCAQRLHTLNMDQYLYSVFAKSVFGNKSVDTTSHPCPNDSKTTVNTSGRDQQLHKIQDMTSEMSLHLELTSYGIGILSNLLLGTYSSLMSRKLLLFIPITGYTVRCVMVVIVVHWNLNVNWFFLGYGVDGICGNACGILLGTFLYTSDITSSDKKRTLGVAIVESMKGGISGVMMMAGGLIIEEYGFLIPSFMSAGLMILSMTLLLFLPDRKPPDLAEKDEQLKTVKGALRKMVSPYTAPKEALVKHMMMLATISFFITLVARYGLEKVRNLYLMNLPFCFTAFTLGWFLCAREILQHSCVFMGVWLLYRWLPGMALGIAGGISAVAGCLMYGLAINRAEIYAAPVLAMGQNLVFSLIRGEASRLVGPTIQGPFFASLAILESISFAVGPLIMISVYRASLTFFPGLVFITAACILVSAIVTMGMFHILWLRHVKQIMYKTLEVSAPVSGKRLS